MDTQEHTICCVWVRFIPTSLYQRREEKPFWVEFKAMLGQGGLDQTTFLSRVPPKQSPSYFHSAAVTKSFAAQIWVGFDPWISRARFGDGHCLLLIFFSKRGESWTTSARSWRSSTTSWGTTWWGWPRCLRLRPNDNQAVADFLELERVLAKMSSLKIRTIEELVV